MAKMCPLDGCKQHSGLCGHDKMMLGMGLLAMVGAALHWGFGLI